MFFLACSPFNVQHKYRLDTISNIHQIPTELTRELETSSDTLRVAWIDGLGWEWRTLIYDVNDNGIVLGAYLIRYNEKLNSRDTLHIDSTSSLRESYNLLSRIVNPPPIVSNRILGWYDGPMVYIAKKGAAAGLIQTWCCHPEFQECVKLGLLLNQIYLPYMNQIPADFTKELELSSDSLRMTWVSGPSRDWRMLIYDIDDNEIISGARLVRYNRWIDSKDTLHIDSIALTSEVYNLLAKINVSNLSSVTSNKIYWARDENDNYIPMIYIAKKKADTSVIQTWHCDIKFPECTKLIQLLGRIYPHFAPWPKK
ncbi:MAG: hypothetical protein LBU89_08700 [Fibromonadaceae bacterium]|nr:hypothetical protein [Fibromonadaceae bacterium]